MLRAGTEVTHDEAWKEQVRNNTGILLSIDGIQPDKGNETIYLLRDVLTGRVLHAENVTDSTKERLKQLLTPIVALQVPVIGGAVMLNPLNYRRLRKCGLAFLIKFANFMRSAKQDV